VRGVCGAGASGEKKRGAEHDEGGDDGGLDHGKPEFEAAVVVDAQKIDARSKAEKANTQTIAGTFGNQSCMYVCGGDHLGADGDGDGEPVAGAGE